MKRTTWKHLTFIIAFVSRMFDGNFYPFPNLKHKCVFNSMQKSAKNKHPLFVFVA